MSEDLKHPSQEIKNAYLTLAKAAFDQKIELTQKAAQENDELATRIKAASAAESRGVITATAPIVIASAFIYTTLKTNTPMVFKQDGEVIGKLNYSGTAWGIALGGGIVWTGGWMNSPDSLVGKANFAVHTNPVHTEVAFFKDGNPVGVLIGAGMNVQFGIATGSGSFTRA